MLTYYKYPVTSIPLDGNNSYFMNDDEVKNFINNNVYIGEIDIIKKIYDNNDGFFNFSKSMIDIGAFVGVYSFGLPFKHRFMFEPNKQRYYICHANMLLRGLCESSDIYNLAVSNECGQILFDGFCTGEYVDRPGWMWYDSRPTKCVTLDSMKDELTNIGFIKIDIEGNEPRALMGAYELIRQNNYPPILFESWPEGFFDYANNTPMETPEQYHTRISQLNKIFDELGYKVLREWGDFQTHLAVHE